MCGLCWYFFTEIIINIQQRYILKSKCVFWCAAWVNYVNLPFLGEEFFPLPHYSAWTHPVVSSLGFFSPPEQQHRALSRELRLCNHCPVSACAFLCLCFLLVLELTVSQWRKGFEPEGSSLYQRLIATSEQGTGPKQTFTVVKRGSAPNDVGQRGFFFFFLLHGLYGDGCQRWTNSRTLAVSSTSRSQIWPHFNSCLSVERKKLIKRVTLLSSVEPVCLCHSQDWPQWNLTKTSPCQRWDCAPSDNCRASSCIHWPQDWIIILHCLRCLAVFIAHVTVRHLSTQ